jgi:ferritin
MISEKMQQALNGQINAELYSAYLYLSMASYFESVNLRGCAGWMRVQAQEEVGHAMKFFAHVSQRGGRVLLGAVDAPPTEWFVAEQVEEESSVDEIVRKLELIEDSANGVFMLDRELAQRKAD